MRSWKQRKITLERRKARRRGKQRACRSGRFVMPAYTGKAATGNRHKGPGFLEKLKKMSWRRIFHHSK